MRPSQPSVPDPVVTHRAFQPGHPDLGAMLPNSLCSCCLSKKKIRLLMNANYQLCKINTNDISPHIHGDPENPSSALGIIND